MSNSLDEIKWKADFLFCTNFLIKLLKDEKKRAELDKEYGSNLCKDLEYYLLTVWEISLHKSEPST